MKRLIFLVGTFLCVSILHAAEVVFVYKDKAHIESGQPWIGTVTHDGILITSEQALEAKATPYIGTVAGELFSGSLIKLDREINLGLIKAEEKVTRGSLVSAHKNRIGKYESFLPTLRTGKPVGTMMTTIKKAAQGPFVVEIAGQSVGERPVVLKSKNKKSEFNLKLINVSTITLWHVDLTMETDPKVSFWKKGKKRSLNKIPRPVFKYSYQAILVPVRQGKDFSVTVEVHYIKEESYEWTLSVKSKAGEMTQKIPIKFKS